MTTRQQRRLGPHTHCPKVRVYIRIGIYVFMCCADTRSPVETERARKERCYIGSSFVRVLSVLLRAIYVRVSVRAAEMIPFSRGRSLYYDRCRKKRFARLVVKVLCELI